MEKRLEQLISFQKENPQDPFLKYAIATEHIKLGELNLGLKGYEALIVENPDYIGTYYHLAKLHEHMQNQKAAIEIYLKGIEIAQKTKNRHALGELQAAYNQLVGIDDEDDDY